MRKRIRINGILYESVSSMNEAGWHRFNYSDRAGYSGAENLPDGSKPFMWSENNLDIILSGDGDEGYRVEVNYLDDSDYDDGSGDEYVFSTDFEVDDLDDALDAYEEIINDFSTARDLRDVKTAARSNGLEQIYP